MPTYRLTWTSIREAASAEEAIRTHTPVRCEREDGSFIDLGLPRADELVMSDGGWILKDQLRLREAGEQLRSMKGRA